MNSVWYLPIAILLGMTSGAFVATALTRDKVEFGNYMYEAGVDEGIKRVSSFITKEYDTALICLRELENFPNADN